MSKKTYVNTDTAIMKAFLCLVVGFIMAFILMVFSGLFLPIPKTVEGKFTDLTEAVDKPNTLRYILEMSDGTLRYMEYKPCTANDYQCHANFKNAFRVEANKGMHVFTNSYTIFNGEDTHILNGLTNLHNYALLVIIDILTLVIFFILFRYWR